MLSGFFVGEMAMTRLVTVLAALVLTWDMAAMASFAALGGKYKPAGKWQQVENKANCAVWNASPQENETVTWTGGCVNGRADGYGTRAWRYLARGKWYESKYTGTIRDGKRHGRGVHVSSDGERYEGEWLDGKQDGQGSYETEDGDTCEGLWREGRMQKTGKGVPSGEKKKQKCLVTMGIITFTDYSLAERRSRKAMGGKNDTSRQ
jgi:hypothetical protein